jgi:heme exporter protein D
VWQWLPRLNPLYENIPINEGNYHESAWFSPLMAFSDRYGFIIWPAVGILAIAAVALAVLKSASHQSILGPERVRVKKEIIHELRRNLRGMSIEQISAYVGHPLAPLTELLHEMVKDGMLRTGTTDRGDPIYKLPGF